MGCMLKQGGGLYARLRVGAVLLAAGEGSRMGGVPKCLMSLAGVPLINRHLIAMSGARFCSASAPTRRVPSAEVQTAVRLCRNCKARRH